MVHLNGVVHTHLNRTYARIMNAVRLSVTVSSEVGAELRRIAELRRQPVSTFVVEAIAHPLRLEALNEALREADREFGPVSEEGFAEAVGVFAEAAALAAKSVPGKSPPNVASSLECRRHSAGNGSPLLNQGTLLPVRSRSGRVPLPLRRPIQHLRCQR
jgi:predicted transcriptional regulator